MAASVFLDASNCDGELSKIPPFFNTHLFSIYRHKIPSGEEWRKLLPRTLLAMRHTGGARSFEGKTSKVKAPLIRLLS